MHENAVKHKSSGGTARSRCLSPLSAIAESRRVAYIGTAIPWSLIPRVLSFRCVHVRAYHAPFGAATSLVPRHVRLISFVAHQARLRYILSPVSHPRTHSVVALWSSSSRLSLLQSSFVVPGSLQIVIVPGAISNAGGTGDRLKRGVGSPQIVTVPGAISEAANRPRRRGVRSSLIIVLEG